MPTKRKPSRLSEAERAVIAAAKRAVDEWELWGYECISVQLVPLTRAVERLRREEERKR